MATDTRALIAGLESYEKALGRHLTELQNEFEALQHSNAALMQVFQGNAAEQFAEGWQRTAGNFTLYISETQRIRTILVERLESLREADRTSSALG